MQLTVPASKMKSHQDDCSARFTRLRINHFMLSAAELSQNFLSLDLFVRQVTDVMHEASLLRGEWGR